MLVSLDAVQPIAGPSCSQSGAQPVPLHDYCRMCCFVLYDICLIYFQLPLPTITSIQMKVCFLQFVVHITMVDSSLYIDVVSSSDVIEVSNQIINVPVECL